ncbi:hypothetical protein ALISP_7210 [Alicycliphilus sp. B1]|nr:hypothetical protein ALISP_7210 [Alicycliphilus sp. B1]
MRNTKVLKSPRAPAPLKRPSWNSTPTTYEASSAGSMARRITRRADALPMSRTVRSVARKMNGKLNAPQVL